MFANVEALFSLFLRVLASHDECSNLFLTEDAIS